VALGTFGGTGGNLQIAGAVAAPDGTVYLNAAGGIGATGSVTGTTILVDAAGAVEIGPGGTLDATQNLWIGYGASGASAAFSGLGVTPAATVGGTTTVAGTADAGDDVGLRSTSGIDIAGSVLAGDWVFLDTAGSIIDTGLVSGIGGVSLNAGGSIDEVATGALIAGTLEGSSGGYTRLDGPANQVSVLAGFTTGGSTTGTSLGTGFSLNDTASLTLQRHAMMASLVEEDGLPVDSFAATSSGLVTVGLGSLAIDVFGRHLSLTQDNRTAFIAKHGKILLSAPSFVQLGIGTFEAPLTVVDVTGDAFAGSGAIQLPAYDETTSGALLLVGDDSMMKGVLDVGELAVIARGGTADFTGLIHGYTGQTAASDQQFARQCANAAGGACTDLSNDLKFNNCAIGSPSCVPLPTVVVIQPPTINESALEPQSGKLDEIDVEPVNTGREDAY
jgi:hypothetical protein